MSVRRRALSVLIAVATLLASPLGRIAVAGVAHDTVVCCCGEHAGDHDCGCPDCPAGHVDGDGHDDGPPQLRACGQHGELLLPIAMAPFVRPRPIRLLPPAPMIVAWPAEVAAPATRHVHPVTPPS